MLGHQDAVRTIEGHKLPLFLNDLSADDLSRGTARIHEEILPIRFWHVSKNRHRHFPSSEMDSRQKAVAQPLYQTAAQAGFCRTEPNDPVAIQGMGHIGPQHRHPPLSSSPVLMILSGETPSNSTGAFERFSQHA